MNNCFSGQGTAVCSAYLYFYFYYLFSQIIDNQYFNSFFVTLKLEYVLMKKFTFSDYLAALERIFRQDSIETRLNEVIELKEHRATVTTMQKHLKQYQAIKKLMANGIESNF